MATTRDLSGGGGGSSQVSLNNSAGGIQRSTSKTGEKHFSHAEINEVTKREQNQYVLLPSHGRGRGRRGRRFVGRSREK